MTRARILYVVESCLGGVSRHVIDLARGCRDAGSEVHILYAPGRMDGPFGRGMRDSPGITFEAVPMANRVAAAGNARAVAAVRRYLRRSGPFDVVHGHSSLGGAVARLAAVGLRRRGQCRIVYTPHAIITMSPYIGSKKRAFYKVVERLMDALTDTIICVSPEEEGHIRDQVGIAGRKLVVVPNGFEEVPLLPRAAARERLGLPAEGVVIGFVGRLVEQKDPEMLIRAFGALRRAGHEATLAMIGDGPLRGAVVQAAEEMGVTDGVRLLTSDDARILMPAFDVLALPSRYEGMPYVALEALAAGLPVVATGASSVGLLVKDGENGFVVPACDPEAFATALGRIVSDPGLRARFGEASRALARGFTVRHMVDATLAAYGLGPGSPA